MDSTLFRAGRATHLKILLVSLIAAIAVVAVGLNAQTGTHDMAGTMGGPAVVKAKSAPAYAGQERATIR